MSHVIPTQPVTAFIFPGQGAQHIGMGRDIYEFSEAARRVFHQVSDALGFDIAKLCFEGPESELNDTINAQPAVLAVNAALMAAVREQVEKLDIQLKPKFVAGHSLGEYSALLAANVFDLSTASRLVRARGRLMREMGEKLPGGMAAVLGLNDDKVKHVVDRASEHGMIRIANFNSPGQTVISGELNALTEAMRIALTEGARKVVRLAVSIAAHSPVMQNAAEQFQDIVLRMRLADAYIPIVSNISAQAITTADEIRSELYRQITESVQWSRSINHMVDEGVNTVVEVGPGRVLSPLVRRIDRTVHTYNVSDSASLQAYVEAIQKPALDSTANRVQKSSRTNDGG